MGGKPTPGDGKFHNHCQECPGFGVCIYDYRQAHCYICNDHYFAGCIKDNDCPCTGGDTRRKKGELLSIEEVDRRLEALGVDPEKLKIEEYTGRTKVSKCVRAAIQRGYIDLKGEDKEELSQVIYKGKFADWSCGHSKDVKLCEVLYQPDYAGLDYADELKDATILCGVPDCDGGDGVLAGRGRMYLSTICIGKPTPGDGKFHNHCQECPGFGECIYDYRNAHCYDCDDHYFEGSGFTGFECHCKGDNDCVQQ